MLNRGKIKRSDKGEVRIATVDKRDLPATPPAPAQDRFGGAGYLLTCLAFLALSLWVCWQARSLTYATPIGPGPAFLPMWLGILLSGLCVAILARTFLVGMPVLTERFLPARAPGTRILVTLVCIAGFALFVERLGFVFTMFVVQLALLATYGCRLFLTGLAVALFGSLGVGYAFTQWLGVYLPPAPAGLLRGIGL